MNRDPYYYLKKADKFRAKSQKYTETDSPKYEEIYSPTEEIEIVQPLIKSAYKRYYDPITRHYFKTDKILDIDMEPDDIDPTDVWYPEHQPKNNLIRDPNNGKLYRVNKIYDSDGNYHYQYKPVNHFATKKSSNNYN